MGCVEDPKRLWLCICPWEPPERTPARSGISQKTRTHLRTIAADAGLEQGAPTQQQQQQHQQCCSSCSSKQQRLQPALQQLWHQHQHSNRPQELRHCLAQCWASLTIFWLSLQSTHPQSTQTFACCNCRLSCCHAASATAAAAATTTKLLAQRMLKDRKNNHTSPHRRIATHVCSGPF